MSLMTDTQGTPERVLALLQLLSAHGGRLPQTQIRPWLDPLEREQKAVDQTLGAARSLGLVQSQGAEIALDVGDCPADIDGLADLVHRRLVAIQQNDANAVVLETYAWFVARSARERGTSWIVRYNNTQLTDEINHALQREGETHTFNTTRYPRWRDWIGLMGLGLDCPKPGGDHFLPFASERLAIELSALEEQSVPGAPVKAERFVRLCSERMPYLDAGVAFERAARRIDWRPTARALGPVFSDALRDLHDRKRVELQMTGDTPDAYRLSDDPAHKVKAFSAVVIIPAAPRTQGGMQ